MSDVNRDPVRWERSMTQDKDGQYVAYHDYAVLLNQHDRIRAELAEEKRQHMLSRHDAHEHVDRLEAELAAANEQLAKMRAPAQPAPVAVPDGFIAAVRDLCDSVNGDCYRGKDWEESQVFRIRALLSAQSAPKPEAVADGFVLVPVEPTENMLMEGCDAMQDNHETANYGMCCGCGWKEVRAAYAAMLAAAQEGK